MPYIWVDRFSARPSLLITIDGPAGAGKTTVSRLLAGQIGYRYLDTGALYRAVALTLVEKRIRIEDGSLLKTHLNTLHLRMEPVEDGFRLIWNHTDITERLRSPEISMMASAVSAQPSVRKFLLDIQRKIGKDKTLVCEGRDMGTVVFPHADIKFFLDASPEVRALRRYRELSANSSLTLEEVSSDMHQRDRNDSQRTIAPLKPADDAIMIDATDMDIDAVITHMRTYIDPKLMKT